MRDWTADEVARAAGARLVGPAPAAGPARAVVDSRAIREGDLFVGLAGEHANGGAFASQALAAGAWGVLVAPEHVDAAQRGAAPGALLAADDPLAALQALARSWRRALGAQVVAITGSTGKTSTKDILAVLLGQRLRTFASPQNFNTEVGLPLALLEAPPDTEAVVVEMGMRGPGQIAELAAIAEPDVGVITNVGPVHVELLGSVEAIADAKAELVRALGPEGCAVLPAGLDLLTPHLRSDIRTITFGPGGEVHLVEGSDGRVVIQAGDERLELRPSFGQAHNIVNLLAAVAAARAVGVTPEGDVDVTFSALRGERLALPGGVVVVNDCYNANPMSMRAALDDLAETASGRTVAVLGDMLELGADERRFHEEVGAHAGDLGVDVLVAVGARASAIADAFGGESHRVASAAEAAALLPGLLHEGDTVLVKASRSVGLEAVAEALAGEQAGVSGR
ncbi:MAG: UDP-N-acetylmuramoyl-tripeptide--D-alanyl-D-alanine ligase [Solirubrobacteraceae bacterium]|jgi:UDP-N-acetylmuramoyl-tripeptide--D-alanyl-D-alanine ligase|nr:UDP-N-acetylmuramoyl-tripeptide--D-alanyl-D-alanine ligase [Solirubrobacteraceae bacterium]